MLAQVALELGKQLVFAGHLHHVVVNHLAILVVADGDELEAGLRVVQQRQLVEHAGEFIVQLVDLDRRYEQGVRIRDLEPDGHRHILGYQHMIIDPSQGYLLVKADAGKLVDPLVVQHITLHSRSWRAVCNVPRNNMPRNL